MLDGFLIETAAYGTLSESLLFKDNPKRNRTSDTEEREIYHWLEDPVNFYVNRYDDYFELVSFMDEFELTLMFDMLYMTIRQISEKDK